MNFKFRKKYNVIIIISLICLLLGFLYLGNYNLIENLPEENDAGKKGDGKKDTGKKVAGKKDAGKNDNFEIMDREAMLKRNSLDHAENGGYDNSDASRAMFGAQSLTNMLQGKNTPSPK